MGTYETEVVQSEGVCCQNTKTLDHFCGNGSLLRKTRSRCIECGTEVHAEVWKSSDVPPRIYLRKYCPEHGVTSARLSSDARFYFIPTEGEACGCGPGGCGAPLGDNAQTSTQLHTCTLVVEIVRDCNMSCPTCYADSPLHKHGNLNLLSLEQLQAQVLPVLERQGRIDILQLSGGEPTLHPDLFRIITWASQEERIVDILLNTNGIRLADPGFARQLSEVVPHGRFGVYLQYDGVNEETTFQLRGGDVRRVRERALDQCRNFGLSVALVMTVAHENKFECGEVLATACLPENDHIRWVVFQPEFLSGRNNPEKLLEIPINVADIVHSIARNSMMDLRSWMPLPCSDPNCGMIGFLVRVNGQWRPASEFLDLSQFAPLIANRMNFDTDDSVSACGCDDYNLGEYLARFNIRREDTKIVFIKPFMDTRTWDQSRIDACCTHVLTPAGKVDSFCRYYGLK